MYYLSDICSLCLVRNQNMKSILSIDSDNIVIEEKLKTFLLEPIHFMPHIPKYICNNCLRNLNFSHKFKLSCIENIATLNTYVEKLEVHGPYQNLSVILHTYRKYDKEKALELENQNNSKTCQNQIQKNCLQNNNVAKYEVNQEEMEETEIVYEETIIIMTENCQINSTNVKEEIKEDIEISFEDTVLEKRLTNVLNNKQGPYEVFMQFNEEKHIIEDSENLTSDNMITSTANENITKIGRKNKNNKERNKKLYNCKDCNTSFSYLHHLKSHSRVHIKEQPYKCPSCHKTFEHSKQLTKHKLTHNEKVHACDVCHKAFNNKTNLTAHKRIHSNAPPVKCSVCNKTFTHNHNLRRHQRIHNDIRAHKCSVCNKAFAQSNDLARHERIHTGEKPYKCNVCNKAFTQQSSLKIHDLIHNNIRLHKCSVCNKAFKQRFNLTTHERIHTGEKPYKCNVCNRAFVEGNALRRHERIHNNVRPYKCSACSKAFTQSTNLNRHMQIHKIQSKG